MLRYLFVLFAAASLRAADPAPAPAVPSAAENAVVKVFATVRYPDAVQPWTKGSPQEVTGSGVVIDGHRILTNAHVVLYAGQIQIQANQSGDKLSARVESISPGIDLAVLKLKDETFFDTHPPLERAAALPTVKDSVLVYGFPTGGTSLSITKGIVSRIEFAGYNYPLSGLRIQIDAAINPGNSGGPAVAGDKMIGLAFSRLAGGAENIGYIIPCEEIDLFLKGSEGGRRYEKPAMFDELQTLQNPALRAFLKAGPDIRGMVVDRPDEDGDAYPLKKWDVITKIGTTPIDDEGMVKVTDILRVSFRYYIQKLLKDGHVPLTVFRQGQTIPVSLPVTGNRPLLVPDLEGASPSYFVFGPIVFSAATAQFYNRIAGNAGALSVLAGFGNPLVTRHGDRPAFPGEQLVVISSPFFPHDLAKGYDEAAFSVVEEVNGIKIKNLLQLVAVLREAKDEYLRIVFVGRRHEDLVFKRQEMADATAEILSDNNVRSQGTPDTMAVWTR